MHFWIDKRSQACGFNGRHRIPASLSSGRRRRSKPMVTPVHRFQSIESTAVQHGRRPQPYGPRSRPTNQLPSCLTPPPNSGTTNALMVARTPHSAELDSGVYLDAHVENGIDTNQQGQLARQGGRKKYEMWASVALSTLSIVGSKAYFVDYQGGGVLAYMLCVMAGPSVALLVICLLSLCRRKSAEHFMNLQTQTTQRTGNEEVSDGMANREAIMTVNNSSQTSVNAAPTTEPEQPPPPYHIAILLPPKKSDPDESPPPSYDNAVR